MCCYYPTTTVAIDDDADFLEMLTQHLGINDCLPYLSPKTALETINDQNPYQRIQSRIVKKSSTVSENILISSPEDHAIISNMRGLHEEIYNKNRFRDVSVIIVDYYMDEINGIDVCKALAAHPAKKILLTGGPDKEKVAIEAFNNGIIHRFINKSDLNFPSKLKQAVTVLKDAYFHELSLKLFPHFPADIISLLQNPAYINFINNQHAQFNSTEFYLLDVTGSMLFLDSYGSPVWSIVKNEDDINNHKALADDHDVDQELIRAFTSKKMFPFFFSDTDYQCDASEWKYFSYPAHTIPGLKGYYYTTVEGHIRNNLNQKNIVSYGSYKNN